MGALVDYWYYTGDSTYNDLTIEGLQHQIGPYNDYMPPNQTLTEGNDDQGFWGMTVMSAAEYNFPDPPEDKPGWLALAQAVFNTQAARWDTEHCNGGLRWQIFTWNNGYNYKNSISQACFFNIAARLALYTGNTTYVDWAARTWDWMVEVRLMNEAYRIYDGVHIEDDCRAAVPFEFSYNPGAFLLGSAALYEYHNGRGETEQADTWRRRVDGLLDSLEDIFFFGDSRDNKVMIEVACEAVNLCDVDQLSFKAFLSRWMAATTKWAPWTFDRVKVLLENSAKAAVAQCKGGDNGRLCGFKWANQSGKWDGTIGVGQQMAAMEVVLANMIKDSKPPVTGDTGGTSVGDPGAGGSAPGSDDGRAAPPGWEHAPLGAGSRFGAGFLTLLILVGLFTGLAFMLTDEERSPSENWSSFRSSVSDLSVYFTSPGAALRQAGRVIRGTDISEKGKDPETCQSQPPLPSLPTQNPGNGLLQLHPENNSLPPVPPLPPISPIQLPQTYERHGRRITRQLRQFGRHYL